MNVPRRILTQAMTLIVGIVLCGGPELMQAQEGSAAPQNSQQQQNGVTVDPSRGPLQPVPSQNQQNQQSPAPELPANPTPQTSSEPQVQQPLGTATAEGVATVGGTASRPAGAAIAPAKQKQRRSLLLKIGLIAAAGIAGGTVYALSKGTPSKPQGAK